MTVFKTRRAGSHLLVRVQTHERARTHTNAFTGQPDENARDRLMGPLTIHLLSFRFLFMSYMPACHKVRKVESRRKRNIKQRTCEIEVRRALQGGERARERAKKESDSV